MDLDDELRRLFQDDRLEIQVKPGADEAVVTGARRLRRRRVAMASAASTLAVATVVAGGVALSGVAGPTDLPPAASSVLTTTTTNPVWPIGYGPVKLTMSEQEALATGVLVEPVVVRQDGCRTYATDGNPNDQGAVVVSPSIGVVRVTVPSFATTGSGIGAGATVADVRAEYPTVMEFSDHLRENMEGKQAWYYRFELDADKKVSSIRMELTGNDCGLS